MVRLRFTLVEVLVAMVIVGILAAIAAGSSDMVGYLVREAKTKSQIQRLETALERYRAEYDFDYIACEATHGTVKYYVDEAREFNPDPLIKVDQKSILLMDQGMVRFCSKAENRLFHSAKKGEVYIPKTFLGEDYRPDDPEQTAEVRETLGLRDGWGNLLLYRCPGEKNKGRFDIWSRGPDGEGLNYLDSNQTEEDDITNWELQK